MKKGVITILGTIRKPQENQQPAKYYFSNELKESFKLKKDRYTNMLPLILDNFKDYGEIKPIYTQSALKIQKEVLEYENIEFEIEKNGVFISEKAEDEKGKYSYFLKKYNEVIENYDKVIIDVSHGFRHLPILATINLIIQNIKNPDKIEYIFFAKEIERLRKYKIIDLKEYLELANLSFMLSTFNQNYTVSNNIKFKNLLYQELADELNEFSNHFLSNSLKQLIEGDLIDKIIKNLKKLQEKDINIENFNYYIEEIIRHLIEIKELYNKSEWRIFYELSKIMNTRGYQLNAITLLFEAVGFYCLDAISKIESVNRRRAEFEESIKNRKRPLHIYSTYTLVNEARVITKIKDRFKISNFINKESLKEDILNFLSNIKNLNRLKRYIETLEALRNNLTHGNSGLSLNNVKSQYERVLKDFEKLIIKENILQNSTSIKNSL